ncbi:MULTISPECIES: phosphopantetheine-binding protein [unclassified Crossiella]|uniref:phosphopantetheine-binding protein n=1 Tax=unclassified Crossiella TaxID=2620835 RepID=UPI00207D1EA7|nr:MULTISPECIES: phosphopantetheine-binding protein [unclassified Crossiella]MCO1580268.1 phosphopantetheine-binding protein [Crossiella sp. SN42]WHT16368.1 phosphopantetheine-binding protein [Crossiella sp. CA-258035]
MEWEPGFEKILRQHLPALGAEAELPEAAGLADLGLDSLQTVDLLLELEEHYGISFPDEELSAETFATAGALWKVISGLADRS